MRNVLLFRLRFDAAIDAGRAPSSPGDGSRRERALEARPFRDAPPAPMAAPKEEAPEPEVVAARREQANQRHHGIVRALNDVLSGVECTDVSEIPGAIDLWAKPDGSRVIFEVKTISPSNELAQTRSGFAQLHEYRMQYGDPGDELCLVVDRALSLRRQKLLDSFGVAVLVEGNADFQAGNDQGSHLMDALRRTA